MKIIKPHNILSREAIEADIPRIKKDAEKMANILANKKGELGIHPAGYALAHSQVEENDPLRFFVSSDGVVVINPKIISHTNFEQPHKEGCLTYNWDGCYHVNVPRWNKITVELRVLRDKGWSEVVTETFNGLQSKIFQHEIDHFNGNYIYDRAGKPAPIPAPESNKQTK